MRQIPHLPPCSRNKGFSLVELLVVVAVIAILAAIIIPIGSNALRSSRATKSLSNQRAVSVAILQYTVENNNDLPFSRNKAGQLWPTAVREYLPGRYSGEGIVEGTGNAEVFYCPNQDVHHGTTDYGVNDMIFIPESRADGTLVKSPKLSRIQEPAKTVMLADAEFNSGNLNVGSWFLNIRVYKVQPGGSSTGSQPSFRQGDAINVSFFDGSVQRFDKSGFDESLDSLFSQDLWQPN